MAPSHLDVADSGTDVACTVLEQSTRASPAGPRGTAVLRAMVAGAAAAYRGRVELLVSVRGDQTVLSCALPMVLTSGLYFYSENPYVADALATRGWAQVRGPLNL